jgi:hypothetical protein
MGLNLHIFYTPELDEDELHVPATLPPGESPVGTLRIGS